jgi:hypothetical protein
MQMKIRIPVIVALVLGLALTVGACAARAPVPQTDSGQGVLEFAAPPGRATYADADTDEALDKASEDRMIVRTADLSLVVNDTEESVARIKDVVTELDGYVVDTRLWRDDGQLRGSVTVRVPANSLDAALSSFKALAVKVERENSSSQDVTEEYTDLDARLRNLEATEEELLELLSTVRERTGKAEDILAVHRELTNIRGQIEQLKGRMQYLERTAAMSAISIELIPDVLAQPIAGTGWRPSVTVSTALRSLVGTLRLVADAVIVIVLYVLPLAIILLIPVAIIWFVWRRWRQRKPVIKT